MKTSLSYGFVQPIIELDHYITGGLTSLSDNVINPSGNWEDYLPTYEPQFNANFDTDGCSVWGTQNAIETLQKYLEGNDYNYSERFTYILAKVLPPGADVHFIAETIRKQGLVDDALLPFTSTFEEFLQPDPMRVDLLVKGQQWVGKYKFGHEWVYNKVNDQTSRLELMKEALKYSPLGISVSAWHVDEKGKYISIGLPNNHWCTCYRIDDDGIHIFDSYDQSKKILALTHDVQFVKRYELKTITERNLWFMEILKSIGIALGLIQKEITVSHKTLPEVLPIIAPTPKQHQNLLDAFCVAIQNFEGRPGDLNYINNNPGNCRCSKVGYRGIYGEVKCVGNFAVFKTPEIGMLYLRNMILETVHEHPDWTIYQYFALKHAPSSDGNDPLHYAETVATQIGISPSTQLSTFLE